MRKMLWGLALGLGAAAVFGAAPSTAQAQSPFYFRTGYQVGNYGYANWVAMPTVRVNVHPWGPAFGYQRQVFFAPAYRTAFTPFGRQDLWASASVSSFTYTPWTGPVWQNTSPAYWGQNVNPYLGFGVIARPSFTATSGLYGSVITPTWWSNSVWNNSPALRLPVLGGSTFVLPLSANATVTVDSKTAGAYQNYVPAGYIRK